MVKRILTGTPTAKTVQLPDLVCESVAIACIIASMQNIYRLINFFAVLACPQ
jgi:hypothetical protein